MNEDKQNYFKVIEGTTLYYEHYVKYLQKQLEAYENMRKEAIEFVKEYIQEDYYEKLDEYITHFTWNTTKDDLSNILNKVGGSDE